MPTTATLRSLAATRHPKEEISYTPYSSKDFIVERDCNTLYIIPTKEKSVSLEKIIAELRIQLLNVILYGPRFLFDIRTSAKFPKGALDVSYRYLNIGDDWDVEELIDSLQKKLRSQLECHYFGGILCMQIDIGFGSLFT